MENDTALGIDSDIDDEASTDLADEGSSPRPTTRTQAQQDALKSLYRNEVMALLLCFISPIAGACLLHALRDQMTRSSEALISNFNLTVFVLTSELRPFRKLIQMAKARTLHLQRIVHANPYAKETKAAKQLEAQITTQQSKMDELLARIEELEGHIETKIETETQEIKMADVRREKNFLQKSEKDALFREMRQSLQPELEMVANAVRRMYKQQVSVQTHFESKFRSIERRLDDAVSLAAAAARGHENSVALVGRYTTNIVQFFLLPISVPLSVVAKVFFRQGGGKGAEANRRSVHGTKNGAFSKAGMDRPPRVYKK